MNRKKSLGLLVLTAATIVFSAMALLGPSAKAAGDNPCDPPHGLITYCKSQHGHFDTSCCCCVGAH